MKTLERLGADDLASVVVAYRDCLRAHQEALNRLNVYPVPDGDTGTNMALTLEAVVAELPDPDRTDLASVCLAVSHGSLMGARGNSGVILSEILRGIADAFRDGGARDWGAQDGGARDGEARDGEAQEEDETPGPRGGGATIADALARAAAGAYRAVQRPVEGTILSVVKAASAAALACRSASLVEVLDAARAAAGTALAATTEQLPTLKAAGVVDAGGAGFVLLLDAFLHRSAARPLPEPAPAGAVAPASGVAPASAASPAAAERALASPEPAPAGAAAPASAASPATPRPTGDQRYEVMYLLEAPDGAIEGFRRAWATIGDSIVVVGGDGLFNCHIHTNDVGAAIEAALDAGRPRKIRVTDLAEQVEEERWIRDAAVAVVEAEPGPEVAVVEAEPGPEVAVVEAEPGAEVACSVVAITTGDGIGRIFASLGVRQLVSGGLTVNPSTAQLLAAVDAAPGRQVVLLPNHRNFVAIAGQAARVAAKPARVVPTRSITEGLAALLEYDPESSADDNAAAMAKAAARIVAGEVRMAARASTSDAGAIEAGRYLGVSDGDILAVAPTAAEATQILLARLLADHHEIVTLIEGEGSTSAGTDHIAAWLASARPDVTLEVHDGGQPGYPYLLSIE